MVPGGEPAAEKMFDELNVDGRPKTPATYPGQGYDLPSGGWVGLRPASKTGDSTTDIQIFGIPLRRIKFV
jgi:hypothetical protein